MKLGKLILLLMLLISSIAQASHILGGEITYAHIKDLRYKVQTVIYRDCNGCKLMGAGGGESTQDCGKIDLFLATADASTCGRKNIVKLSLERKKIQELLPVCSDSRSKCQTNSSLSFGVEAHYFDTEIDFNDYVAFKGCGFEIFTNISWRTKGISTIDDDQPFYNFAYIYPWMVHHSPEIKSEISPIIYCNQPYYYSHAVNDPSGDSLSFHMVSAKSDYNKDVAYKSGYSATNPLDVYCPSCTPDETAFPPTAFNFNARTGDLAFTPVSCGQTAVIVLEVRKWAMISGSMKLISTIRRDLQYIVINSDENNPPHPLTKSNLIQACAGEEISFDIDFEDKPYKYPDQTYGRTDSLVITWDESIAGASLVQNDQPQEYKFTSRFTWKTTPADVRNSPYRFTVYVNDGACPLNAISSRTYEIIVVKPSEVELEVKNLECGYREVTARSNDILKLRDWTVISQNNPPLTTEFLTESVLFMAPTSGKYFVRYQAVDQLGCNITRLDTFEVLPGDFDAFDIELSGNQNVCETSAALIKMKILGNHKFRGNQWIHRGETYSALDSLYIPNTELKMKGLWTLKTTGVLDGRACSDSIDFILNVNELPKFDGDKIKESCGTLIHLKDVFGISVPGTWSTDEANVHLSGDWADFSNLDRRVNQTVEFKLLQRDSISGCSAEEIYTVNLKILPEFKMEDIAYCKNSGNFYIDNLVSLPTSKYLLNLSWRIDDVRLSLLQDPNNLRWYVPSNLTQNGDYKIVFTQTGDNGCSVTDSSILTVLDDLKIGLNSTDSICGGVETNLHNLMGVFPAGGGWYCSDNTEFVKDNQLTPEACGDMTLSYTYDKFGCYDRAYVKLYVECIEPIQLENSFTKICSNYSPVQLVAKPSGGTWTGNGVSGGVFNPAGIIGQTTLTYTIQGLVCSKESAFNIEVQEAPEIRVSSLAANICEGQIWLLNNMYLMADKSEITASGILNKSSDGKTLINYTPSTAETQSGKAILQLKLTNEGLCAPLEQTLSAKISQQPSVSFNDQITGCAPEKLKIQPDYIGKNDPATDWDWTIQDEGTDYHSNLAYPVHTYTHPGTYDLSLSLITNDKCTYQYAFPKQVTIHPSPVALFESDPSSFASQLNPVFKFKNLSSTGMNTSYLWNFGTGRGNQYSTRQHPTFTFPNDTGKYLVSCTVTNEYGCTDEATQWVEIGTDIRVYIPNAFTPDGKGPEQNARYRISATGINYFHISIINRWGGVVYESEDISDGWDGLESGKPSAPGVYVYDIQLISRTGKEYKYSGTLNLIR